MCKVLTIKEYANSRGISYNSARKMVERYRDVLGSAVTMDGRTHQLNTDATIFLDEKRAASPDPAAQKILALQVRVHQLEKQVADLQSEVDALKSRGLLDRLLNRW